MAGLGPVRLKGATGASYRFNCFALGTGFASEAAVYVVTRRQSRYDGDYEHAVLCVGEMRELRSCFNGYHSDECVRRCHANCVSTSFEELASRRRRIASDLVEHHSPPCQDRTAR